MRVRRETAAPRLVTALGGGVLIGAGLLAGPAAATEVKYPTSDPRIVLEVPDNWVVSTDANGLDLVSPEKNARVLVGIVYGNEQAQVWAKTARGKLVAAGTKFDERKPTRTLRSPGGGKQTRSTPLPPTGFGFTGTPSVGGNFEAPVLPGILAKTDVKPFEVVQTSGSMLDGKPVDEELYFFKMGSGDILLLEQQTGSSDERGVAIERSLKILK